MPKKTSKYFDEYIGEIVGQEWGMGGMFNLTSTAYLAVYETPEDRTVAEYEFRYAGRKAINPVEASLQRGFRLECPYPILYVWREGTETQPPPEILEILTKAKEWKKISTAHPYIW